MKTSEKVAFGIGVAGFIGSLALGLDSAIEVTRERADTSLYVSNCEYAKQDCKKALEKQGQLDGDNARMVIGAIGFMAVGSYLVMRLENIVQAEQIGHMEDEDATRLEMLNMEAAMLIDEETTSDSYEAGPEDEANDN